MVYSNLAITIYPKHFFGITFGITCTIAIRISSIKVSPQYLNFYQRGLVYHVKGPMKVIETIKEVINICFNSTTIVDGI